jgi:hypothetical protein
MRHITTHQASPLDKDITLHVLDEPGHGGACHEYMVTGMRIPAPLSEHALNHLQSSGYCYGVRIPFQNGPANEAGVNGVSNEVLLAIVADRLEGFQAGPYACEDNGVALAKIKSAMGDLQQRTKARLARGVEGTSVV